jgi:hypothetical protein
MARVTKLLCSCMNTPFSNYIYHLLHFYDTYMCIAQASQSHFKINKFLVCNTSLTHIGTSVAEKEIVEGWELLKAWISNTH